MSLPRMSLHIGDYKKDTGHLRAAGHGGYLLLMMHYWATGSLPNDNKLLQTIACMTEKEWKHWQPILKKLFKGNFKTHKRIDQELAEARKKYNKRAVSGALGGIAKASNARRLLEQTPTNPNLKKEREVREEKKAENIEQRATDRVAPSRRSGAASNRASRLPDDFALSEAEITFAAKHGFAGDPLQAMYSDFCDYWHARAGSAGVKLDWPATWRRWVRTAAERRQNSRGYGNAKTIQQGPTRRGGSVIDAIEEVQSDLRRRAGEDAVRRIPKG